MSNHLTERQVADYRDRRVRADELLAIDDHTSACGQCALLIRDSHLVRESVVSWRADFETAETGSLGHISFEQLSAYVDSTADLTVREMVESHLQSCGRCSGEIADLRRFSVQFTNVTAVTKDSTAGRSFNIIEWLGALWGRPRIWIPLQLAATTAAFIFLAWLFTNSLIARNAELTAQLARAQEESQAIQQQYDEAAGAIENLQSQIADLQKSYLDNAGPETENRIAVSLNDGEGQVTLDRAGNLTGLRSLPPSWQQAVKTALITEQFQTSPTVSNLIGKTGALMGGSGEGIAFSLLGPVGTTVLTDRPVFRWSAVVGATSYLVAVHDSNFNWVATSQPIPPRPGHRLLRCVEGRPISGK